MGTKKQIRFAAASQNLLGALELKKHVNDELWMQSPNSHFL
jgi:hypothetical protein